MFENHPKLMTKRRNQVLLNKITHRRVGRQLKKNQISTFRYSDPKNTDITGYKPTTKQKHINNYLIP